jgi:hypothetical protein
MTNKKTTAGFILVFSFLFLFQQSSYSQGASTSVTYEVLNNCCGSSVPDDTTQYVARMSTGNDPGITFYRIYCKICCYLLRSSGRQQFPEENKVTDPALIKKLRNALKKQLAYKTKLVNDIKY